MLPRGGVSMGLLLCKPFGVGQPVEPVIMSGAGEVLSLTRMHLHGSMSPPSQAI